MTLEARKRIFWKAAEFRFSFRLGILGWEAESDLTSQGRFSDRMNLLKLFWEVLSFEKNTQAVLRRNFFQVHEFKNFSIFLGIKFEISEKRDLRNTFPNRVKEMCDRTRNLIRGCRPFAQFPFGETLKSSNPSKVKWNHFEIESLSA